MADRKKNGTRTQTAELKTREKRVPSTKEEIKPTPAPVARTEKSVPAAKDGIKATPAPARTEKNAKVASTREARRETIKREPAKQEPKASARRDAKAPSTFTRLRNSKAGRFVYDAYYELRYKVSWPTFEEARNMAILVVVISAVLGLLIAGTDFGLYRLFQLITTGK